MKFSTQCKQHRMSAIAAAVLAVTVGGFSLGVQAGKIISLEPESVAMPPPARGFGGWNLGNVDVLLTGEGSTFNEATGYYSFGPGNDGSYVANITDSGFDMGTVLAKPWPVGEPSGIKVINGDAGVKPPKPTNCIMATSYLEDHYLDTADPQQVLCSGPFQSHKRFKVAMLPATVDGGLTESVDLVFNVEAEPGSRDYQVFQKINNWTGKRLQGFTVQLGFGVGSEFTAVTDTEVALENLNISVPSEIWAPTQLANFSAGLFGPLDKHTGERGFFDPDTRAGFYIEEYGSTELTDTLHSGATLGSNYSNVPAGAGEAANQFGTWLPNTFLPDGVFFDDDGNPETDAALLAWYGFNPDKTGGAGLGWMGGSDDGFAEISADTINEWGENLFYTQGEIDDLVNVGLNYVVSIGDVSAFPASSFTIRITPIADTSGMEAPDYTGAPTVPLLQFPEGPALVSLDPAPFVVGSLLTARVGDHDLAGETSVLICFGSAPCAEGSDTLTLIEQGDDRKVFAASLPASYSEVTAGTLVTMTYYDASQNQYLSDTTEAIADPVTIPSDVTITSFSVADTQKNGQTRPVKIAIQNARGADVATGEVQVSGMVGDLVVAQFSGEFSALKANGQAKFNWRHTAVLADATVAETIAWTANVIVKDSAGNPQEVDDAAGATLVTVKNNGKNSIK